MTGLQPETLLLRVAETELQAALESSQAELSTLAAAIREVDYAGGNPDISTLSVKRLSDAIPILASLDRAGSHTEVRSILTNYHRMQRPRGEFRPGEGQMEATGCALWSMVDHARLTGDLDYLRSVYRCIRRGVRWIGRRRNPDSSEPHSGLMPPEKDRIHGRYPVALWTLAGVQEAARAAAVLNRQGHLHDSESLFHELKRAVTRSLDETARRRNKSGFPSDPDQPLDLTNALSLVALMPGEVFPPDFKYLSGAISSIFDHEARSPGADSPLDHLSSIELSALSYHLLRRGDVRTWKVIEILLRKIEPGNASSAYLVWVVRNLLVLDHHSTLLIAPGYAVRPPEDGTAVWVKRAPTYHGPVTYRLERAGEELILEWEPLTHRPPQFLIWPLAGIFLRSEPPGVTLTESRMGIHLDPGGGRLRVLLAAGTPI